MDGAIWLHRQLLDSSVFASEKRLKIWIWILLKASYKNRSVPVKIGAGQSIVNLKRGELIFGRFSAEESLNIDGSTIYKILKYFESEKMINIKSNSHYTIITICNYDIYQSNNTCEVTAEEQQSNNQVTAEEQPSNTYNKDNKDNKVKNIIPTYSEFEIYALEKEPLLNKQSLKLKYDSWIENGWKTGLNKPIKNWKSTLLNTIQYLQKDIKPINNEKPSDFFAGTPYGKDTSSSN